MRQIGQLLHINTMVGVFFTYSISQGRQNLYQLLLDRTTVYTYIFASPSFVTLRTTFTYWSLPKKKHLFGQSDVHAHRWKMTLSEHSLKIMMVIITSVFSPSLQLYLSLPYLRGHLGHPKVHNSKLSKQVPKQSWPSITVRKTCNFIRAKQVHPGNALKCSYCSGWSEMTPEIACWNYKYLVCSGLHMEILNFNIPWTVVAWLN